MLIGSREDFNFQKYNNTVARIESSVYLLNYYKRNMPDKASLPTKYKAQKGTFIYLEAHLDSNKVGFES